LNKREENPMHPLEPKVIEALRKVYDPEIPVNLYDLGLIYELNIADVSNDTYILMTLTTPNCPIAEDMPGIVLEEVKKVEGIGKVTVNLTFDPPWSFENLTEEAKLELGLI
jgi:FeS assembly SUF system protein